MSTNEEVLSDFCRKKETTATAAVWERVSETALLTEVEASGVLRRTFYIAGEPAEEQLDPRPQIQQSPDGDGVRAAMAAAGLSVDEVFGRARVSVVTLKE